MNTDDIKYRDEELEKVKAGLQELIEESVHSDQMNSSEIVEEHIREVEEKYNVVIRSPSLSEEDDNDESSNDGSNLFNGIQRLNLNDEMYSFIKDSGIKDGLEMLSKNWFYEKMDNRENALDKLDKWLNRNTNNSIDKGVIDYEKLRSENLIINYQEIKNITSNVKKFLIESKNEIEMVNNVTSILGPMLAYRMVMKFYIEGAYGKGNVSGVINQTRVKDVRKFALISAPMIVLALISIGRVNPLIKLKFNDNSEEKDPISYSGILFSILSIKSKIPKWGQKIISILFNFVIPIVIYCILYIYFPNVIFYIQSIDWGKVSYYFIYWYLLALIFYCIKLYTLVVYTRYSWGDKDITISKYIPKLIRQEFEYMKEISKQKNEWLFIEWYVKVLIAYILLFVLYVLLYIHYFMYL